MKARTAFLLCCFCIRLGTLLNAQRADSLTPDQFRAIATRCAPGAAPDTLIAIAIAESDLYTNAISLNYPERSADIAGYKDAELFFARQPKNRAEAIAWMYWLEQRHYSVSVGVMQVNIENAQYFHVPLKDLFEPCTNIAVGARIVTDLYVHAKAAHLSDHDALLAALSAYNTGSYRQGFQNGYVDRVLSRRAKSHFRR